MKRNTYRRNLWAKFLFELVLTFFFTVVNIDYLYAVPAAAPASDKSNKTDKASIPPAIAYGIGTQIADLQALLASLPQHASAKIGEKTPSGLPRIYRVTAEALKSHATLSQVNAIVEILEKDIKSENVVALWSLAKLYELGIGVQRDYSLANDLYRRAATKDDYDSISHIGYLYENGYGVKKDAILACEWYEKAAIGGNSVSQYNISHCYREGKGIKKDPALALSWLEKAAKNNFSAAQYKLGAMYLRGDGVKQDNKEALQWLNKAAVTEAAAQNLLGELYRDAGAGLKVDLKAAVALFRKAAPELPLAAYNLALMVEHGHGTKTNFPEAIFWYSYASDNGLTSAQMRMAELFSQGRIIAKAPSTALKLYGLAADAGLAEAQYRLGMMLAVGDGAPRNTKLANAWLLKAAAQGHAGAKKLLKKRVS